MKPKKIIILIVAILLMVGSVGGLYFLYKSKLSEITVYEASMNINEGVEITEDMVDSFMITGDKLVLSERFIIDKNDIVGKFANVSILEGTNFEKNFIVEEKTNITQYRFDIKEGYVYQSIETDLNKSVGGLIKANDYINLIGLTLDKQNDNGTDYKSVLLLEKVKVIEIKNKSGLNQENVQTEAYVDNVPYSVVIEIPKIMQTIISEYRTINIIYVPQTYEPLETNLYSLLISGKLSDELTETSNDVINNENSLDDELNSNDTEETTENSGGE